MDKEILGQLPGLPPYQHAPPTLTSWSRSKFFGIFGFKPCQNITRDTAVELNYMPLSEIV
jgi:hypothetical protein